MKNITVITTGGTIGSVFSAESVSIDSTQEMLSSEINLAKDKLGITVKISAPINKHSENMHPGDWVTIIDAINRAGSDESCDGIVVTHGSDTIAYAVAAASILCKQEKPVCFTGSYYAPEHPDSDASINLLASLSLVSEDKTLGLFAAFSSNIENSEASILHGHHLKPMAFDDLFLSSAFNEIAGTYSLGSGLSRLSLASTTLPKLFAIPSVDNAQQASKRVGMIMLYPGVDKAFLKAASKDLDILVIQGYHCGTGPYELIQFIKEASPFIKVLIATLPSQHITTPYKSTLNLKEAGAYIYRDIQAHYLYVLSVLALGISMTSSDIIEDLSDYMV